MPRKYEQVWIKLKAKGRCELTVHPSLVARVKKAVGKEKYNDLSFKLEWEMKESPTPKIHITHDSKKNTLLFVLIKPITMEDL